MAASDNPIKNEQQASPSVMLSMLRASANPRTAPAPEKLTLWHTSDNPETLKSFLNEGAKTVGVGRGGQTNGFYLWNRKENAESHFNDFLHKNEPGEGLLIGTTVDLSQVKYPDWQFDVELSKELSPLFFKYREQISQIQNLEYTDIMGEKQTIRSMRPTRFATEDRCMIAFRTDNSSFTYAIGDDNGLAGVDVYQSLIDHMCKDESFRKDYEALLRQSMKTSPRLAIKYCGPDTLRADEVLHIQKDDKGTVTQTPLYTSSQTRDNQVCPFLKMGLAQKKDRL